MKRSALDILACPIDKHYPLELFELATKEDVILDGILFCPECNRYYPIIEEIPIMLPDELRKKEKERDLEFMRKWKDSIPEKIIKQGKPWHL